MLVEFNAKHDGFTIDLLVKKGLHPQNLQHGS